MSAEGQEVTAAQSAALLRAISPDRLSTYTAAAAATGTDVLSLYLWDRDLAAAFLADIAVLEVALRNSMHAALSARFGGEDWYTRDIGLDDRSRAALTAAWNRLKEDRRTPGRVVAQLMFGFWSGLLDAGGYTGRKPQAFKCDYETLWRSSLNRAFPGGRVEARVEQEHFTRHWTSATVSAVQALRNRAAHHEPLVGGFPLPGQRDQYGNQVRRSAADGHQACLKLARLLDRDLASWLATNSRAALALAPPA